MTAAHDDWQPAFHGSSARGQGLSRSGRRWERAGRRGRRRVAPRAGRAAVWAGESSGFWRLHCLQCHDIQQSCRRLGLEVSGGAIDFKWIYNEMLL